MRKLFGILIFLIGAGFVFFPTAMEQKNRLEYTDYTKEFKKAKKKNKKDPNAYKALRKEMEKYNKEIFLNGQKDFKDPWSVTQSPVSLKGYKDDKFGTIKIPSIKVKLPLYIGATNANMRKGAVILGYTSMPIGGMNTNSAIAAHRGYQGIPFFCEIEKVKVGDKVIIDNIWEKLTYKVSEIKIISPDDSDQVKIQPGKDMLTLITCHPYRSNGKYRYLVYCQRSNGKEKKQKTKIIATDGIEFVSSEKDIEREKMVRLFAGVFIVFCGFITFMPRKRDTSMTKKS